MARTTCKCGAELTNHLVPNDIQLVVYTRSEWEKICEHGTIETWMIPWPRYDVWRCPVCKRIAVYDWADPVPLFKFGLEENYKKSLKKSNDFGGAIINQMICKCGVELKSGQDSNDNEFLVYTDIEWDEKICITDTIEPRNILPPHYSVRRCQKCERIMVYDGEVLAMVYGLEKN